VNEVIAPLETLIEELGLGMSVMNETERLEDSLHLDAQRIGSVQRPKATIGSGWIPSDE
jgi:hypothetical protein